MSLPTTASRSLTRKRVSPFFTLFSRSFSQTSSRSEGPSFGIAFDIDGVLLLGHSPVGGSPRALRRLYDDAGTLKVPYIFLTNGGGFRESKRAHELSQLLGVNVSPEQVVQGHSPFKNLVSRFKHDLVVAVGKGEPAAVMSDYGFKNVLSIDEYASCFENIDPLLQYKNWTAKHVIDQDNKSKDDICSERVKAAFIVSDPIDWSRDIQVLCDILRTGGLPGNHVGQQPSLFFASDDLEYQAAFPSERLGMGGFRIALEAIFNRIHPNPLQYTSFGKPNPSVFGNAQIILEQLAQSVGHDRHDGKHLNACHLKTMYMIGDNPSVDIRGAQQAGHPWFSILTRTGVFKGKGNHPEYRANLVVDTVEEAVDYILRKEYNT